MPPVRGGVTYRVVSDHLGTPRIVVDQGTGSVVERLDADEWGNVTSDSNPGWEPFGFDGGIADAATGLVRFGARDLDPRSGRWTAKDPVVFGFDSPNPSAFVSDDSVNAEDPSGLCNPKSECIRKYRLHSLIRDQFGDFAGDAFEGSTIAALAFVDVPKPLLPPFRAIGSPSTTVFSSVVGMLGPREGGAGLLEQDEVVGLRAAGR